MRKIYLSFVGVLLAPAVALADATVPVTATNIVKPSAPVQKAASDFKVTGYVDGSYNNLVRNYFTSGAFNRVFDQVPNGFTLQQAAITLAYQPSEGLGGLLNLIAGRDANIMAPYGFMPYTEFRTQTFAIDFPQAFIQYAKGPVTVMGGRFLTLVGYEQLDPTQDTNFSRGILFYNTPDTHLGIRAIYTATDKMTVTAGVNDGWDNIRDWTRRKTVELSFSYNVNSFFNFALTGLNGQERATPQTDFGPLGDRTLIDLVATVNATENLSLVTNYDYGWQTKAALPDGSLSRAGWQGIAGYINYKFCNQWQTSLRGELFYDSDGFRTGVRQKWSEVTLTVGYSPIKNLVIRAETRRDFSNVNSFTTLNSVTASNNTQSYALEAFYKFG